MYEKPHLTLHAHFFRIDIIEARVGRLLKDLQDAGFEAKLCEGTFGFEDLNKDTGREEVASVELPSSPDKLSADRLAIRGFLRGWQARGVPV